jgi:hypothetical protein
VYFTQHGEAHALHAASMVNVMVAPPVVYQPHGEPSLTHAALLATQQSQYTPPMSLKTADVVTQRLDTTGIPDQGHFSITITDPPYNGKCQSATH